MKRRQTTTFYIETLVLIAILILVILILTRIFGIGRGQSEQARILTGAVSLAQDAAEAVSASRSPEDAADLLNDADNAVYTEEEGILVRYNSRLQPDPAGEYCVKISWVPEEMLSGTLVSSQIDVTYSQMEEPVYSIETAVFLQSK